MTKEQFDNQKWHKNMPVQYDYRKEFVKGVNFEQNEVLMGSYEKDWEGTWWVSYNKILVLDPKPTALDLIAQEREKQISKGYTVEHDAAYTERNGINYAHLAARLLMDGDFEVAGPPPPDWDQKYWDKLCALSKFDRIRIAATWMARELERLLFIQNKEACDK